MENKLLAWQFALRLSLDNWSADVGITADDLQMTTQRQAFLVAAFDPSLY
jgi:hypothetical protein